MTESQRTASLIVAATLVNSVLAGGNVIRSLVEMPAWQRTGPRAWAAFSRHADLGPTGMVLYPLLGFAGAILSGAAALSYRNDRARLPDAAVSVYGAALLTLGGLLMTTRAAPNMLSVRRVSEDAARLQQALDGFQFWGNVRAVFQVLAFVANLWSLAVLSRSRVPGPFGGGMG